MTQAVAVAPTGPADVRDQRWLDERIGTARNGIEAVIDIALNWTEGRGVGRLHPGVAPAEYIREHVGIIGREAIIPLLTQSNWSNRQIAEVAGVDHKTVAVELGKVPQLERPAETLGGDGKLRTSTPARPRLDPAPYKYDRPVTAAPVAPPEAPPVTEVPIDTHLWDALVGVMNAVEALASSDAPDIAAAVPARRRAATAKRLRTLGMNLGRIAWVLEGSEATE